jgi:hypothetical protein
MYRILVRSFQTSKDRQLKVLQQYQQKPTVYVKELELPHVQRIEPEIVDETKPIDRKDREFPITPRWKLHQQQRRLERQQRRLERLNRRRQRNLEVYGCYCIEEDKHDDKCPVSPGRTRVLRPWVKVGIGALILYWFMR